MIKLNCKLVNFKRSSFLIPAECHENSSSYNSLVGLHFFSESNEPFYPLCCPQAILGRCFTGTHAQKRAWIWCLKKMNCGVLQPLAGEGSLSCFLQCRSHKWQSFFFKFWVCDLFSRSIQDIFLHKGHVQKLSQKSLTWRDTLTQLEPTLLLCNRQIGDNRCVDEGQIHSHSASPFTPLITATHFASQELPVRLDGGEDKLRRAARWF